MNAVVKGLKFNQPLGSYKVTVLSVKTDKGEDKDYNIFTNAKFHYVVAQLKAGDNIEIKMEKNGKYWNVSDVQKVSGGSGDVSSSSTGGKGGGVRPQESANKDIAIARAVTIKAATEVYAAMITAGLTKKGLKVDAAAEEVLALCKKFEGYLTLSEDLSDLSSDTSALNNQEDSGYDEQPFE